MMNNRVITLSNLSNEANMCEAQKTQLLQLNTVIFIGIDCLRKAFPSRRKLPLSVTLDNAGVLKINGIEDISLSDDRIRIYSDRKVTTSSDSKLLQPD